MWKRGKLKGRKKAREKGKGKVKVGKGKGEGDRRGKGESVCEVRGERSVYNVRGKLREKVRGGERVG